MEEYITTVNTQIDKTNVENGKNIKNNAIMIMKKNIDEENHTITMKGSIMDLDADCIAYLFLFLEPKYAIRLWIVCRWNCYGITPQHKVWKGVVKNLLGSERLNDVDEIYSRLNIIYSSDNSQACPIDNIVFMKELYRERKCGRSGCYKIYRELDNYKESCCYHPGTKRSTKLSCCKAKNFSFPGCKYGYHNGHFFNVLYSERPKDDKEKEKEKNDKTKMHTTEFTTTHINKNRQDEANHLPMIAATPSTSYSLSTIKPPHTNNNTETSSLSSLPPIQPPNHFQQANN